MTAAVVLAAEASADGPAALYPWGAAHLLEAAVAQVLAQQQPDRLMAVLGAEAERVLAETGLDCEVVIDYDWGEGQGASLRAALDLLGRDRHPGPAVIYSVIRPLIPAGIVASLLAAHRGGVTAPLYKYETSFPLVIDRSRWDWFMGRNNPPLDVLAAHPDWLTPIRFESPPPARIRNLADAMALSP